MRSFYSFWLIAVLALFGTLSACNLGNATGYVPTRVELNQIKVGTDTQSTIREHYGRPTVVGETENAWYYISSQRKYPGFLPTQEVERRILAIAFDRSGRVLAVEEFSLEKGQDIDISRYVTETGGRKLTLWEQLRGNIGNLSPEDFLDVTS